MCQGERLHKALEHLEIQQQHRRVWAETDDAESVAQMIQHEALELIEAIQESFVTGDVFSVASEIADILYLAHRLCNELGFDAADLLTMKTLRNSMKYSDAVLNNGYSAEEAVRVSKEGWKAMGGDVLFSHAYLDVYAEGV